MNKPFQNCGACTPLRLAVSRGVNAKVKHLLEAGRSRTLVPPRGATTARSTTRWKFLVGFWDL